MIFGCVRLDAMTVPGVAYDRRSVLSFSDFSLSVREPSRGPGGSHRSSVNAEPAQNDILQWGDHDSDEPGGGPARTGILDAIADRKWALRH